MNDEPVLRIDIDDTSESLFLSPGQEITYGREADVDLGVHDAYVSRVQGRIKFREGRWWLQNTGRQLATRVRSEQGQVVELPPNGLVHLPRGQVVITVKSLNASHSLRTTLLDAQPGTVEATPPKEGPTTAMLPKIPLNPEQRLLLTALCENRLRHDSASLIANSEIGAMFRWGPSKVQRKLDYICERLTDEGVEGVKGGLGYEARDRRAALVDYCLASGLVAIADLDLLDGFRRTPA